MNRSKTVEQEKLYARILENIHEGIIAVDQHGNIHLINPAAQYFTGLSERQTLGRPISDVFSSQKTILQLVETGLRSGRSISDHEEVFLYRSHGAPLPIDISVSPLYRTNGEQDGLILILHDVSRLKELKKIMLQADRLSGWEALAVSLAHEIKNPLGGIKGAAQLLALELDGSERLREFTQVMIREVERVNGIVEDLMDLNRPRSTRMEDVELTRILSDVVFLQKEAHRHKEVVFDLQLDPSIPPVHGDPNQLAQLFINLVKNAAESIDRNGRVEIRSRVSSDYNYRKPGDTPSPVIVVEVSDNGPGIPTEETDRVFTPFYTTKAKGNGLGLPTCRKIADEHGALLTFSSEVGKGTTFSFSIPLQVKGKRRIQTKSVENQQAENTAL